MPNLATNKKALADYTVLEKIEGGLVLRGAEVKSAKAGRINLKGSYVSIDNRDRVWLTGVHISAYPPAKAQQAKYDPDRQREVLLHKKEIDYLRGKSHEAGLTIVPISVYTKGSLVKVELALVRGKHTRDKRQAIRKRETDREVRRLLRGK